MEAITQRSNPSEYAFSLICSVDITILISPMVGNRGKMSPKGGARPLGYRERPDPVIHC